MKTIALLTLLLLVASNTYALVISHDINATSMSGTPVYLPLFDDSLGTLTKVSVNIYGSTEIHGSEIECIPVASGELAGKCSIFGRVEFATVFQGPILPPPWFVFGIDYFAYTPDELRSQTLRVQTANTGLEVSSERYDLSQMSLQPIRLSAFPTNFKDQSSGGTWSSGRLPIVYSGTIEYEFEEASDVSNAPAPVLVLTALLGLLSNRRKLVDSASRRRGKVRSVMCN